MSQTGEDAEWRLPDFLMGTQKRDKFTGSNLSPAVLPTPVALSCVERIKTGSVQGGC